MSKATQTQWRIQYRDDRSRAWKNRPGLVETRQHARQIAANERLHYGFGNTRVVRYEKAAKK